MSTPSYFNSPDNGYFSGYKPEDHSQDQPSYQDNPQYNQHHNINNQTVFMKMELHIMHHSLPIT